MASITSQSFAAVEIHISAGQLGETNFVRLTTGRLEIDEHLETTLHMDGVDHGMLEPKKLGSLSRASAVLNDESGRSLDVKMNKHGGVDLYRFTFRSARDAATVAGLAEEAMMKEFNTWASNTAMHSADHKHLLDAVKKSLGPRRPLLFEGVQLLGPDPSGEGSEVLLGDGIVALLDPNWQGDADGRVAGSSSIGEYELLFFGQEEGAESPIKRFPIGPKMSLQVQDRARAEIDDEEEAALTFTLTVVGKVFTLAFESLEVAESFERDFTVRERLMTVALSTAKKTKEVAKMMKSPLRMKFERAVQVAVAVPAVALLLASQSKAVSLVLCHLLCQ